MKGAVAFLLKDKHRIPAMSLAEILFVQSFIILVSIMVYEVLVC